MERRDKCLREGRPLMQLCMLSCKEGFIAARPAYPRPVVLKKPAFPAKDPASEGESLPASMCFEEKLANFVLCLEVGAITATSVETSSWTPKRFSECAACAFVAPFMRQPTNSFNSLNPPKADEAVSEGSMPHGPTANAESCWRGLTRSAEVAGEGAPELLARLTASADIAGDFDRERRSCLRKSTGSAEVACESRPGPPKLLAKFYRKRRICLRRLTGSADLEYPGDLVS